MGPAAGDAVNPQAGPAAGGCAFGRLRSSASQAKRPHPWGLGRGIHAADTPATGPTPPSTVFRDLSERRTALVGVDLGRHGRSTSCVDEFTQYLTDVSTKVDTYQQPREPVEGGAVSECGVSAAWARGMPRAGWAGRPTPVLPCAQESAHEQAAAKPAWTYLRRPRTPTPPRQPTECQLLLLPLRLPASGRHYQGGRAQPCRKTRTKKQQAEACCFGVMVRPERFELPTAWFVARYSIQLSYGRAVHNQILLHFQRRMLKTCRVVRPERFELPTAWFVARYSIQLSYGRPATGAELCGCRRVPSTVL